MALQYTFGAGTSAPTSNLDANFQTVGLLGTLPCSASGTNTITLTLLNGSNTPTVAAYANFLLFSFIAAATNTGAVTARLGTLAPLAVYKATSAGPAALVAGDITINNLYILTYNAALNSGVGGFQINAVPIIGQTPGTTTNDNANAGNVGEYQSLAVTPASPISLTSATLGTITSLALTAGDWDVTFEAAFHGGASTTVNNIATGIATVGTISTVAGFFNNLIGAGATLFNYGADPSVTCGPCRFSLSAPTTLYALAKSTFGVSTLTAYGLMRARRVR